MPRKARARLSRKSAISYRIPMMITDSCTYLCGDSYAKCPRCLAPVDRDFQAYCDRCGQALNWDQWNIRE